MFIEASCVLLQVIGYWGASDFLWFGIFISEADCLYFSCRFPITQQWSALPFHSLLISLMPSSLSPWGNADFPYLHQYHHPPCPLVRFLILYHHDPRLKVASHSVEYSPTGPSRGRPCHAPLQSHHLLAQFMIRLDHSRSSTSASSIWAWLDKALSVKCLRWETLGDRNTWICSEKYFPSCYFCCMHYCIISCFCKNRCV